MLCIDAVHYTRINTCYVLLLYTTHISNTCYVLLLYTTHVSTHAMYCCCTLHTSTHAMYCCCTLHISTHAMYCCCTLHTYQLMLCIVAVHYTCINTCYVLLLYTTHINTCYVLLLYTTHVSTHAMYCCCTLHTYQHMLCIVAVHYTRDNSCYADAIVDCTHIIIGSTTAFFKDLVTLYRRTYSRYYDIGSAMAFFGQGTVDQEQELHKPNSCNGSRRYLTHFFLLH